MDGPATFPMVTLPDDAILHAVSVTGLCQTFCDAVIASGHAIAAVMLLAQPDHTLSYAGSAGSAAEGIAACLAAGADAAADIARTAFLHSHFNFAGDYAEDFLVRPWREAGVGTGSNSAVAFPLLCAGENLGVFLCFLAEPGAVATAKLPYLARLAGIAAFRLRALREAAEKDRFIHMVKALSESNEAILRAESRDKLFPVVCDAAINAGKFVCVLVAMKDRAGDALRIVGSTSSRGVRPEVGSILYETRDISRKFGLSSLAFSSGQPAISNDYVADQRNKRFESPATSFGIRSAAALPLLTDGKSAGVLLFLASVPNSFTQEFVEVLQRLAGNISFALDNFDRADAKAEAEERVKYLATHDNLTNLPNRAMFNQLLDFSIQAAGQYQRQCAILFIDLDRFKVINDSLGHAAGDALLIEMGNRLRRAIRGSDIVARLGGDEFMVLLNEISDQEAIFTIANTLLNTLSKPLTLNGQECRVTASIGVARFPDDATNGDTLMKHADIAMYLAKAEGKNGVRFFSSEQRLESLNRLLIEAGLRQALERNELSLHYQPKLEVATRKIAGVEALLRWNHPELGPVPPSQFIPVAEETGLIVPIGCWVLKTACAQAMAWHKSGLPLFAMAVNVSPRQFSDDNLLRDIDAALEASGLPAKLLQIEITESMVMLNVEQAITVLDAIQSRGVRLAIDDFGTGYSSMSTLKRFPIDTIKIDRSFIRDLPQNAEDKAIAQAIISMGKALGLTIVAEGVETVEQDEFLRTHLCDEIQGYLFGKPVPPERIGEFL